MSPLDRKSYLSLAQIYHCLGTAQATQTIENILKHEIDINCKVPADNDWCSCKPELLGSTALHLAVEKDDAMSYKLLLHCGADFTIKDDKGFTALHRVVEKLRKDSKDFWNAVTENEFIKSTISAHVEAEDFSNPCNSNRLSHFHVACMANNHKAVEHFLKNGADVDLAVDSKSSKFAGWTPLHFAARSYSLESVKVLLTNNANRGLKHSGHMTASDLVVKRRIKLICSLTIASEKKYPVDKFKKETEMIEKTLGLLVSFNNESGAIDASTFHAICSLRDPRTCESLKDRLPNPDYRVDSPTWTTHTAIHMAAYCNVDTVKLLMSKNFNVVPQNSTVPTPLDILISNCQRVEDVAAILSLVPNSENIVFRRSDCRADSTICVPEKLREESKVCWIFRRVLVDARLSDLVLTMRDAAEFNNYLRDIVLNVNLPIVEESPVYAGCTPLHLAVMFSERFKVDGDDPSLTLIDVCLKRGAHVTVQNVQGQTPIHLAFRQNKMKVVELLLNSQRSLTNPVDKDGLSHLHIACAVKNVRLVRSLVDHVDVSVVYKSKTAVAGESIRLGFTPLHVAVVSGCVEAVELLVKAGANVYERDTVGCTPIHRAFDLEEAKKVVDILLQSTVNFENHVVVIDNVREGLSLLHVACSVDNAEAVAKMLELGANINAPIVYKEGETDSTLKPFANFTPLEVAMNKKSTKTVELLLQRGADILTKKPNGEVLLISVLTKKDKEYEALFLRKLWDEKNLQKRLETELGVSMLHIACHTFNLDTIAELLESDDIEVNAQVPAGAHNWAGKTPLHLFLSKASVDSMTGYEQTLRMLLGKGASVTIVDAKKDTPMYEYACFGDLDRSHLRLLLDHHRDFTLNPTSQSGVSHFHFACIATHVDAVRGFLECGNVDVDRPLDVFFVGKGAGLSPLNAAVLPESRRLYGVQSQVDTVDLLLKHKADPTAEDVLGCTVLHEIATRGPSRVQLFEKFAEHKVFSNHQNIVGETPFEELLKSRDVTVEDIEFFLKHDCQVNSFNPMTGEGYMSMLISKKHQEVLQEKAFDKVVAAGKGCLRDDAGRTLIHNIVACTQAIISVDRYVEVIDEFTSWGIDVDERDELGKTALHVAAHFGNQKAIAALLRAGADVNIVDADDKSAFSYAIESKVKSSTRKEAIKHLANHVYKLQHLKLDVSQLNDNLLKEHPAEIDPKFAEQLNECRESKRHSVDLEGFLSETGTVASYCAMLTSERAKIDRFFEAFHKDAEDLTQLKDVLRLQYRKAVARLRLKGPSVETVESSMNWQLPNVTCRMIVRCMSNSDLRGLIATGGEDDECEMMDVD